MYKFICIFLIAFVLLHDVNGKRAKKTRISLETAETTPQPNVVTYSTFGFKDVGTYEGFVPSSPDFGAHNMKSNSGDSSTRLYAPAFPSSIDATGLGSYYDPQPDAAPHTITSDGYETHVKSYQPGSMNFFTSSSYDTNGDLNKNNGINYNNNSPTYGTKLGSRNKNRNNVNHTDYMNIYNSVSSVINGNTATADNVSNNNYPLVSTGQSEDDKMGKIPSLNGTPLKFPRVVDFTGVKNYYPTSVESNTFTESMHRPYNLDIFGNGLGNLNLNAYDNNKYNIKDKEEKSKTNKWNLKEDTKSNYVKSDEQTKSEVNSLNNEDGIENYPITVINNLKKNKLKKNDYKDKITNKEVNFGQQNNLNNKHSNGMKGYEYSTNYSNTSFKYEAGQKRPFDSSIDEIVPAGSNLDFVDYQYPDKEYQTFKPSNTKPQYNFDPGNAFSIPKNKYKLSEDYLNSFKPSFTTPSTSSHWGSIFKDSEFSSYKSHPKKPSFSDESNDDIVHIPKRLTNQDFAKYFENNPSDLDLSDSYKPYKPVKNRDPFEWLTKDSNNRYKSEEDLLGLRNHDTSHPSYVPSYKPNFNNFDEDIDYKKLAAKWKHNFLKAKLRDSVREYETFASEPKPVHVPFPKPYPIEVPHPVVVPVPQPYPVKVPIPKPVAVPVIRELTVPVEKPVPYPVIKKVPYPIEKLVPVPVVKQVRVPVAKPFPVHVPQIQPVFHHTKSHDDDREIDPYEEEYITRPDNKRPSKRPKHSRRRPPPSYKRPSRAPYYEDRSRRRIPNRRPTHYPDERQRRPYPSESHSSHRYREEFDEYDSDSDFERYCRRTGKC